MSEEQDSTINNSHVDTTQLKLPTKALPTIITEYVEKDEVLFKGRAKVFIFFAEDHYGDQTFTNIWKERGLGDVKILRNTENNKCTVCLNQEKTFKNVLNFMVDPRVELIPNKTNEKSWVLTATDFSDETPKVATFAIILKDLPLTKDFKLYYNAARKINAAVYKVECKIEKEDLPEGFSVEKYVKKSEETAAEEVKEEKKEEEAAEEVKEEVKA